MTRPPPSPTPFPSPPPFRPRCSTAARRDYGRRSRGDAEGFFHLLHQFGRLEQRQPLDFLQDRIDFRHDSFLSSQIYKLNLLGDRKSTRLNSSHSQISYAVFC